MKGTTFDDFLRNFYNTMDHLLLIIEFFQKCHLKPILSFKSDVLLSKALKPEL